MFVKVQFQGSKKFIKLNDGFTFTDFITEVQSRFEMHTGADLRIYDESHTEIEQDLLGELLEADPKSTLIIEDLSKVCVSEEAASSCTDTQSITSPSSSELHVPSGRCTKKSKMSEQSDEFRATSAKEMVLTAIKEKSKGDDILEEYKATNTLSNEMRRALVNILVGHMTEKHGRIPPVQQREQYALGIVTLFPSLKDPFSKKGYEHFYDAASGSGYLAWRLKTVLRNTRRTEKTEPTSLQGGPKVKRAISLEQQLDGDAALEAISLLAHTGVESTIFEKMRQTFRHRQELVQNADTATDVLKTFPRFLDTKGLVNQDFELLFNLDTSSKLMEKWDRTLKPKIIQEAKNLTQTPAVQRFLLSAEKSSEKANSAWDSDLSTLLLLVHLLPPSAGRKMAAKISATNAADKLVLFHKSCCSIDEHLGKVQSHQPYLLAVGRSQDEIDNYYIALDSKLIPCQTASSLGALDELFKVHYVFNISYDNALDNFYTFLQTTVYNIDVGKTKESPRVKELRAKFLNNT